MYLKLPAGFVDPRTHAPLPDAVLVIGDAEVHYRAGDTRILAAIYASPAAIGTAEPVIPEVPLSLSPAERDSQSPALLQALYTLVAARAEYTGSTLVV